MKQQLWLYAKVQLSWCAFLVIALLLYSSTSQTRQNGTTYSELHVLRDWQLALMLIVPPMLIYLFIRIRRRNI